MTQINEEQTEKKRHLPNDLEILMESGSDDELQRLLSMLDLSEKIDLINQLSPHYWRRLLHFIGSTDLAELILEMPRSLRQQLLNDFHPSDLASLLTALTPEQWPPLVEQLEAEQLSALLTELEEPEIRQMVPQLAGHDLPELFAEMESDDAADILGDLPEEMAQDILERMPEAEAEPIEQLLQYEEDTAGGLMQTELIRVLDTATATEAIEELRRQVEKEEGDLDIYVVYVVDDDGQLQGHIALDRLILAQPESPVSDMLEPDHYWVNPELDQEEVAETFQRYDLISLPVVDQERRLLGRITIDDVVDVIAEEASEDILQMGGVSPEGMVYDKVLRSAMLRIPWLFTNLFGGLLTGYLMWSFKGTLGDKLLVLLVGFVPVITGMGGNVGTQSSSITVRGFAINRIDMSNFGRYLLKEMRVGAVLGLVCGLALSLVGWIWHGKIMLGVCVGIALFIAMTLAASMGTLFPALFEKLDIDPALASGPFVTTFNDVSGILIYFGTATLFRTILLG